MSKKLLFFIFLAVICVAIAIYLLAVKNPRIDSSSQVSPSSEPNLQTSSAASNEDPAAIPAPPDDSAAKQAINEIRRELQDVMELNQAIGITQTSKSVQLLKIQEQAVIHRKILSNIEQLSATNSSSIASREALLMQEKLRVIREETLRNRKALEQIKNRSQTS